MPGLQVFLGLVARLEKGKHDMSFGATALDLANRIVFLSVGKCCCFVHDFSAAPILSLLVLLAAGMHESDGQRMCWLTRWCADWLCLWSGHTLAAEVAAEPWRQATAGAQG